MPGTLSQFSDVQLAEVYRYTTLELVCAAQTETAAPPASTLRVQRLFRSPYVLIDAVADFNRRRSAACIEKLTAIPAAECGDPWDLVGEQQLEREVLAAMRPITRLAIEGWNVLPRHAAIFADIAARELRQRIREEYEAGRDAHLQALASLRGPQTAMERNPDTQSPESPSSSTPPPTSVPRTTGKRSRDPITAEILHRWFSDPRKKPQLLAAGSAEGIGILIGKSKSAVIEAGPIWDNKIKPALAGQRAYARMERSNDRDHH